ncbi:MAG: DUF4190 domain-containing protein [Pyrinomonadaceae bacterium]
MKQCPRCNKIYSDETLNFCLDDGELLTMQQPTPGGYREEPPTMVLDGARVTDPISWGQPPAQPPAQWQQQSPTPQQQFGGYGVTTRPDQTLATVAMILGIISLAVSCCYGGLWLGIPAAITGFIALRNVNTNGEKYGGRNMAIGGIIMGGISFLITMLIIIAAIAGNIR